MSDALNTVSNWYQRANGQRSTIPLGSTDCYPAAMTDRRDIDVDYRGNGGSRRQSGRQTDNANGLTSSTMTVHDDPVPQSNGTRDGDRRRGEDNGRRNGREPGGGPDSSDSDEDDDRRLNRRKGTAAAAEKGSTT